MKRKKVCFQIDKNVTREFHSHSKVATQAIKSSKEKEKS